jgi:hypothetical protein
MFSIKEEAAREKETNERRKNKHLLSLLFE